MKKNYILHNISLILAVGIVPLFSGCNDFLTRDSDNQTTEEAWWYNKSMLQGVLNQCYLPMPGGTLVYDAKDITESGSAAYNNTKIEMEGLSDNGVTCANYINNTVITYGTAQSTHEGITNIWTMKWTAIRRCCRYLDNYKKAIVDLDSSPWEGIQSLDRWAAEVRALRAFYHLELYIYFGRIPIVDHVVAVDEQDLSRATDEEDVNWIASEFEKASENLPVYPQVAEERWRWTKGACYAYISYLYLYVGNWEKAKEWAQKVIDLGIYDIYTSPANPANSYNEQFLYEAYTNNTKECILTKNLGCSQTTGRLLPPSAKSGTSGISPTSSLIDAYELKDGRTLEELSDSARQYYHLNPTPADRDPRLGKTIFFPGETYLGKSFTCWTSGTSDYIGARNSTVSGYWVKKWMNPQDLSMSSPWNSTLPFQLMRYSVVLLNYVECQIELGNINDPLIYTYLDKIRARAGMPAVDRDKYKTQDELRALVRRERRVELAFEGYRLYDIRRWKIADKVMNGPVYGAKKPDSDELYYVETRRFNPDRDYLWPIPSSEISANEKMEQNPGY